MQREQVALLQFQSDLEMAALEEQLGRSGAVSAVIASALPMRVSSNIVGLQKRFGCLPDIPENLAGSVLMPVARNDQTTEETPQWNLEGSPEPDVDEGATVSEDTSEFQPKSDAPIDSPSALMNQAASALGIFSMLFLIGGLWVLEKFRTSKRYKKRSKRFNVSLAIQVEQRKALKVTHLIEISRTGCKVKLDGNAIQKSVKLRILGEERRAKVVWSNAHYAGLKFVRKMPKSTLSRILFVGGEAVETQRGRRRRPGSRRRPAQQGAVADSGPSAAII